MTFSLHSPFKPTGDQPEAIAKILEDFRSGKQRITLLGATGTGKSFSMANVIQNIGKPTLILSHNKTLAAQLYNEMKLFFPDNAVEYFVSYFDYYQPEAYKPASDTYVEKETQVNEELDRMRLSAMHSLSTRKDVIIVASVSCIYGIGDPGEFSKLTVRIKEGDTFPAHKIIRNLVQLQYQRNDTELKPGHFRRKGETLDIIPGYSKNVIRVTFFDDDIESISEHDPITMQKIRSLKETIIFSAKQFVFSEDRNQKALKTIREELEKELPKYEMLEAHRLEQRTTYDLEMIENLGYCTGIENYSRHFDGRKPGQAPYTLLDFLKKDFLMIIDESHVSIPQIHGMYKGDLARKKNLVEYGFRLPCAFDNRPLKFEEFDERLDKVLYVSATPADYELEVSQDVVEQIIRPTGLLDPLVEVRPTEKQMFDILKEIERVNKTGFKTMITTLTKRMAEHLSEFLAEHKVRARYLHSEIDTLDRSEIIRQLRANEFDVLVGINLLREGLDIPEVSFIAILDADKQGFLRNTRSLVQIIGRAARNAEGRVVLYADTISDSMQEAMDQTRRRREIQEKFNKENNIVPKTIIKPVEKKGKEIKDVKHIAKKDVQTMISEYEEEMNYASEQLDFEKAILLRDKIATLQERLEE